MRVYLFLALRTLCIFWPAISDTFPFREFDSFFYFFFKKERNLESNSSIYNQDYIHACIVFRLLGSCTYIYTLKEESKENQVETASVRPSLLTSPTKLTVNSENLL